MLSNSLLTFLALLLHGACGLTVGFALLQVQCTGTHVGLRITFGPRAFRVATGWACKMATY